MAEGAGNPRRRASRQGGREQRAGFAWRSVRRDVARSDAALGGSGCRLGGGRCGGRHSTTWLSALEVEVDRSSRSILGTYSMLTSSRGRRFNLKKSSLCHVSGGFEMG